VGVAPVGLALGIIAGTLALFIGGDCRGAFTVDTTAVEPGGTAELSFELSMHTGMDGWHDIAVHVPVTDASGEQVLDPGVTGNFVNT